MTILQGKISKGDSGIGTPKKRV